MIRRSFRIGLTLGVLAGLAYAVTKMLGSSRPDPSPERGPTPPSAPAATPSTPRAATPPTPPRPAPAVPRASEPKPTHVPASGPATSKRGETPAKKAPTKKAPAKKSAAKKAPAKKSAPATVWVTPDGDVCPTSHPVKAKLSSKIFHLPGMLNYDRTQPDRCYRDAGGAEGDGLRAAKR